MNLNSIYCILILSAVIVFPLGCSPAPPQEQTISGLTMGTYYRVILSSVTPAREKQAARKIEKILEHINKSMSVFDPESEIARFNRLPPGRKLCPSTDFQKVMKICLKVHEMTRGAFDPALAPLINLWGFGTRPLPENIPEKDMIDEALSRSGLNRITMDQQGCLTKDVPGPVLNLSAVAKGFAADAIAAELRSLGITSFLIDIGGEILAGDKRPDGSLWQVGIAVPLPQAPSKETVRRISIAGRAVATSGDYRNFFIHDNIRYSHIIDPATGFPVRQQVISASVLAENCALADALATAALVMGRDNFLRLAQDSRLFEALLISRDFSGKLHFHSTEGFH